MPDGREKEHTSQVTSIDLGDDLLEKSALTSVEEQVSSEDLALSAEERLQNAKILAGEGLKKDAKKNLRRILLDQPNQFAQNLLNEIEESELKHLLEGGEERRYSPFLGQQKSEGDEEPVDPEAILRQLDQDLNLGLFEEEDLALFLSQDRLDSDSLEKEIRRIENSLQGAQAQDWIDLGIAFLEMSLYRISSRLFSGACRKYATESTIEASDETEIALIAATSLLGLSLVLEGRPFDAISALQPLLQNGDIEPQRKVEIYYLMGRIYESINKRNESLHFFRQVVEVDAHYRDVEERIKKLAAI